METMETMATNINYRDLNNCCRTCMGEKSEDSEEMYDIFSTATGLDIAEIITLNIDIKVQIDDRLPKKICDHCYNSLKSFHEFRKSAERVDIELKEYFNKVESYVEKGFTIEVKLENDNSLDDDQFNDTETVVYQQNSEINDTDKSHETQNEYSEFKPNIDNLDCNITKKYNFDKSESNNEDKGKNRYTCTICSQTFKLHHLYVKHLLSHSQSKQNSITTEIPNDTDKTLKCNTCSLNFKSIYSLSAHQRKHVSKDRVLACSICKKVFKKISPLKRHEASHEVNRPYKCSVCSKSFVTETTLTEHINKHKGVKSHVCPICSKAFAHLSTLTSHVKIHTKPKPYLCSTCGKRFESSTNLNQHLSRHMGLKPFACDFCPQRFVTKGELKSHTITHTGEKQYSCDQCSSFYSKRSSLTKHKRLHLGIRPYQCDTCSLKFTTKDHLTRHIRIHTGERPYRCDICERAFTQSNDLIKHKRSHLGNNVYQCTECPENFKFKTELRQHLSDHFLSSQTKKSDVNNTGKTTPLDCEDKTVNIPQMAKKKMI